MPSRLDTVLRIVVQVAYANLLWVIFTLAGGVVLGVAPATVAVMELSRDFPRRPPVVALRTFARSWWRSFVPANLCAGAVASVAVSAVLYLARSSEVTGSLGVALRLLLVLVVAVSLVGTVHVLAMLAAGSAARLRDQIRLGLVTAVARPSHSALVIGVVLLDALLLVVLPGAFVAFGVSLPIACLAALSRDALSAASVDTPPRRA